MDPGEVEFTVEVADGPGGPLVAPRGELDMATQPELREALARYAERGRVTLDLSGLTFMDTSGMRLILEIAEAASRDGFSFAVLPGSAAVQRLFEVAGVAELVPFRERVDRGAS